MNIALQVATQTALNAATMAANNASEAATVVPDVPVWALVTVSVIAVLAMVAVVFGLVWLLFNFWWKRV